MGRRVVAIAVLSLIPLAGGQASAWWDEAHAIIAEVATSRLTPQAQAAVTEILKDESAGRTLVAVSGWADTVRKTPMPETYNWHFVDIPVEAEPPTYDRARDCKATPQGDCIVAALDREVMVLRDGSASPTQRAQALMFVTHLVGDLHQPLHCAERNHDLGGNTVKVTFFGAAYAPAPHQDTAWSLHAVWDGGMIDHAKRSRETYVRLIKDWIATQDVAAIEVGAFADWANETHRTAVDHTYRSADGTAAFPSTGGEIGDAYQAANIGVVDQQLGRAAVRLAKVLNDALSTHE